MIETFSHPHLENCSFTIIMTRVKTKQNKTEMNKTQKKLWKSAEMVAWISTYIPYFFTYKPSDSFSIWHKGLGDFFTRNGVQLVAKDLGFKNKCKFNVNVKWHKFHDCSALHVSRFKIVVTATYFWPLISFFASHSLKDNLTQFGKTLLISHHKWNIWPLFITCLSSLGYLGVRQPILHV